MISPPKKGKNGLKQTSHIFYYYLMPMSIIPENEFQAVVPTLANTVSAIGGCRNQYTTIDEKHTEIMNKIGFEEHILLPELIRQQGQLKETLKTLKTKDRIDERLAVLDLIEENRKKIKVLKGNRKKYLLDNCSDLFHYFEEHKKVSSGKNDQNANRVKSFFKIKTTSPNSVEEQDISEKYYKSRNIYNNYWKNVNNDLFNVMDFKITTGKCIQCNLGELIVHEEDGVVMCNMCFQNTEYIMDSSKPSNKEIPNEVSYTAYIRLNHFKEILSQFQAKETTQIHKNVIEAIRQRIKKERITDLSTINNERMRDILRRLKLNKYFEHIQYIKSLLGIRPPTMSEKLIETLCVLFIEIQEPWAIYCPETRTNFFNYTYPLYQFCVLLDQTQYLPYIPMLKDVNKQKEQDMIWKKVCAHLDWFYSPTV